MNRQIEILLTVLLLASLSTGCAPVISKQLRDRVDTSLRVAQVRKDPEAYRGKWVMWGGVIVGAKNTKGGTVIEVLNTSINAEGRPKDLDRSEGRFLAQYDGYLDVAVYTEGREITIAGVIHGKRVLPLGEIQYTYPLVLVKEIHLWRRKSDEKVYPYPYWHYPWWWYHPYWGPW
jgi:outer membrane lipoprotein